MQTNKNLPIIWLAGNPNAGKTLLFNTLTGLNSRVANYPGITVECNRGKLELPTKGYVEVIDLPGTYSLCPRSEDEALAVSGIMGALPESAPNSLILAIVDATNLERNLYLVSQLLELGCKMVVALTFLDACQNEGNVADVKILSERLGVKCVAVSSVTREGIPDLISALESEIFASVLDSNPSSPLSPSSLRRNDELNTQDIPTLLPPDLNHSLRIKLQNLGLAMAAHFQRFAKHDAALFENLGLLVHALVLADANKLLHLPDKIVKSHARLTQSELLELDELVNLTVKSRYKRIERWLANIVTKRKSDDARREVNGFDRFSLHPVFGVAFLLLIFAVLFNSLFLLADPAIYLVEQTQIALASLVRPMFAKDSLFGSLIVDGVISGVGSVLSFVPLIAVLFFFLGILEDSGYLARATFLVDRLMAKVGLSGRAFVPLLSGFACAVPAIMATRVMESRKSQLIAIMITPFMSCSARLPVYGILIAAVFSSLPPIFGFIKVGALIMFSMYLLGIVTALLSALVFKLFVFKHAAMPLILELPPYRMPRWHSLLKNVALRVKIFLSEAGTVIMALTIVMWALFTFPRNDNPETPHAERLRGSYAGMLGQTIEPVIAPLGFDWKMGIGIIASFAAREVFVPTLGVIYGLESESAQDNLSLRDKVGADFDQKTALSLMAFFALSMQCMSTLAVTYRETRSIKWPIVQFSYMSIIAWLVSFAIFQLGTKLGMA